MVATVTASASTSERSAHSRTSAATVTPEWVLSLAGQLPWGEDQLTLDEIVSVGTTTPGVTQT